MDERPRRPAAAPLADSGRGARANGPTDSTARPEAGERPGVLHLVAPGSGRRARLAVLERAAAPLTAAGFDLAGRERLAVSDLAGRRPLGALDVSIDGETKRLLVRSFEHGGLLRWATGRRFLDRERPVRELELATALLAAGFPTAPVIAARARPAPLFGWWLELVSERLENTSDLGTWLESLRAGEVDNRQRRAVFAALGNLLARAHSLGLAHADLQPRNVLVRRDSDHPELFLIDLDRSRLEERLAPEQRAMNLARLLRATLRRERRGRPFLFKTDGARVLRAYCARLDRQPGRALGHSSFAGEWRATARALDDGAWIHRLGWWIEGAAGAKVEARDGSARVRG